MEGTRTKPILAVEDEKDIVDLIEYHLRQSGFPVIKALDGPSGDSIETIRGVEYRFREEME